MALYTEDVVTRFQAETDPFEAALARLATENKTRAQSIATDWQAASKVVTTSQTSMVTSQRQASLAALSMGSNLTSAARATEMLAKGQGDLSSTVNMVAIQLGMATQAADRMGGRWGRMMATVSSTAPWIALGAAVGGVGWQLGELLNRLESVRNTADKVAAGISVIFESVGIIEEGTFRRYATAMAMRQEVGMQQPNPAADAAAAKAEEDRLRKAAARTTTPRVGKAQEVSMLGPEATAGAETRVQAWLAENEEILAEQARFEESMAALKAQGVQEQIAALQSSAMAAMDELGVQDQGILAQMIAGKNPEDQLAILQEFDAMAIKIGEDMAMAGQFAKQSAAAGFQAFFASLAAFKGVGSAAKAAAKALLETLGQQALGKAAWEFAEALASIATGNFGAAGAHFKASAAFTSAAMVAGMAAAAVGSGGGGGGIGAGRGGRGDTAGGPIFGQSAGGEGGTTTIYIEAKVSPGAEANAGAEIVRAIEAHERESGRRRLN